MPFDLPVTAGFTLVPMTVTSIVRAILPFAFRRPVAVQAESPCSCTCCGEACCCEKCCCRGEDCGGCCCCK